MQLSSENFKPCGPTHLLLLHTDRASNNTLYLEVAMEWHKVPTLTATVPVSVVKNCRKNGSKNGFLECASGGLINT
jgi:hypothetical protein